MSASSIKELHVRATPNWESEARALAQAGETFILVGFDSGQDREFYETITREYGMMGGMNHQAECAWFSKGTRA